MVRPLYRSGHSPQVLTGGVGALYPCPVPFVGATNPTPCSRGQLTEPLLAPEMASQRGDYSVYLIALGDGCWVNTVFVRQSPPPLLRRTDGRVCSGVASHD